MHREVFQYLPGEETRLRRQLLGFYVLVIGLSVRLTKVTAELSEWHVLPKTQSAVAN
jgi:hypothetical protein